MSSPIIPGKGSDKALVAYLGHILSPISFDRFSDYKQGALVVDATGVVCAIGNKKEVLDATSPSEVVDYGNLLILPGFVDLHTHLVQIAQVGCFEFTLLGWLQKYTFPSEAKFADPAHARKLANWFFRELSANGTTLSCVFTSIHKDATDIAFETAAELGCRTIMGKVMMDVNSPAELMENTEESLRAAEELCLRWHGYDNGRLLYSFTPRFAPTCTSQLMSDVGELWRKYPGSYLQTHLSENTDECAWVQELFPQCSDYVDVYEQHGLLGNNSLFAHAIHLSDKELSRLAQTQSGLAHCPSSNFYLKSGVFPYSRVRQAGIKFGLGSDIAGGPEMSMFRVMKDAANIQTKTWITPTELFFLSTLGGAQTVNLSDRVGSLDVGKDADFVIIDPTQKSAVPQDILERSSEDILSTLIFVGDDRNVISTFVRGLKIYDSVKASHPLVSRLGLSRFLRRQAKDCR